MKVLKQKTINYNGGIIVMTSYNNNFKGITFNNSEGCINDTTYRIIDVSDDKKVLTYLVYSMDKKFGIEENCIKYLNSLLNKFKEDLTIVI